MDHEGLFLVGGMVCWLLLQSISTVKKRDARYKEGFRILKSSPKTIFINIVLSIVFGWPVGFLLNLLGVN
jgi:hypothetical protein